MLDDEFEDCPWSIPPAAILKFVPIAEDPVGGTTNRHNSEAVLRDMIGRAKMLREISNWEFCDAGLRPPVT